MLGRVRWGSGRKVALKREDLLGLPVLLAELPRNSRRPERNVKQSAELFRKKRVTRVLTPPEFPWWAILVRAGLQPVETRRLRIVLAPAWVEVQLERRNIRPTDAVLCLQGEKTEYDMELIARELCPLVRNLILDFPGGYETANRLRRELGIPILPRECPNAHLTLRLDEGPLLIGAKFALKDKTLPDDCEADSLISALWESGRVKTEEILLRI